MELVPDLEISIAEAIKYGLSKGEVMDILGIEVANAESRVPRPRSKLMIMSVVVGLMAVFWGVLFGFQNPKELIKKFQQSYQNTVCLVDHTEVSLEFMRPITNCTAMCKGMKEVPRLSAITQEEFLKTYAYTGRPLVVTGATANWTALNTFSFDYFKKLYEKYEDAYDVQEEGSCQFFAYKTNFAGLEDVFGMSKKRATLKGKKWYVGWSNCHTKVMSDVRKHYAKPDFLPADSETSQQDWFFMGGSGPGAPVHIDTVERPSWQAQISGVKSWYLIPPVECEDVCFPVNVTMNKGDIVVVDTNQWFHSTYIHPGEISITVGAEYD